MTPGAIVQQGERLYAVLAASDRNLAVAPLVFGRVQARAGDVAATTPLGPVVIRCGASFVMTAPIAASGMSLSPSEVSACTRAAERVARDRAAERFTGAGAFAAAQPSFRSGGRRVGGAPALA